VALYWEGDGEAKTFTFKDLSTLSNKFANVLKKYGVGKGDKVCIFLPRVPELYISFLGIVKAGAVACPLFAAFGSDGLRQRLDMVDAKAIITNSELAERLEKKKLPKLQHVIIIGNTRKDDIDYRKEMEDASNEFEIEHMDPEDDAFIIYASGTEGEVDAIVHSHSSIVQQHITAKWVLDLKEDDVYWCTADPGWVTGTVYGIIANWSNGASSVVHGGRFDPDKWCSILEKYRVTVWYTAPTAFRMLMQAGAEALKKYNLSNLRHICSVGEPLNPPVIEWFMDNLGLAIHDTWWQSETGSVIIANYASLPIKLGSMGRPIPGIEAAVVDDNGKRLEPGKEGDLVIKPEWPSLMKTILKQPELYNNYFKKGWYYSNDRAFIDKDGYVWFKGRSDDIIKTSGERVGPFEVESALVAHPAVVEAGVIGKPDPLRGEIIKAFVVLKKGQRQSDRLKSDIQQFVKHHLAGHAYPKEIEFVENLPKTPSGKIMRRMLKAKELGLPAGDTSVLEK